MYSVTLTDAPAEKASWNIPVAWINALDEFGKNMVFSVMKNGCVCDGNGRPIGTIADKKYMALRRAAQEVIASKKGRF